MIILNQVIHIGTNWNNLNTVLTNWYTNNIVTTVPAIRAQREQYIAPVASSFPTGATAFLPWANASQEEDGTISNLSNFEVPYGDRTVVVPDGVRRAFALSVADVNHLTTIGSFSSAADRGTGTAWWLRTLNIATAAWNVHTDGRWHNNPHNVTNRGVRPALIIHQQP